MLVDHPSAKAGLDPFLPLDWRAKQAKALERSEIHPDWCDDRWVGRAIRFLRLRTTSNDVPIETQLSPDLQPVQQAFVLHEEDGWPRRLEAWLLTGVSLDEVSSACELSPSSAEAYAMLFFDVLGCREARSYLAMRVLPKRAALGVSPDDIGGLLKLVAYTGGPLALQSAIRVLSGQTIPPDRFPDLDILGLDQACDDLLARFSLLMHRLPLQAFSPPRLTVLLSVQSELGKLHEWILAIRRQPAGVDPPTGISDAVERYLLEGDGVMAEGDRMSLVSTLVALHEAVVRSEKFLLREAA